MPQNTTNNQTSTIRWEDIETECGDYRAGFVAIFRKYEGQLTDETDKQGRTAKVTATSFARHMGIPVETFRRWVKQDHQGGGPAYTTADRRREDATRAVRQAPETVVDAIMDAPDGTADQIFDNLKLRRAGHDTTPGHRKAARAIAEEAIEPLHSAFSKMDRSIVVMKLEDATELLRESNEHGQPTDDEIAKIEEALHAFNDELAVAKFKVEVDAQ